MEWWELGGWGLSGAIGAVAIGAAAPLIVEKLAQQLPSLPTSPKENNQ
jgi:hypothetical protein